MTKKPTKQEENVPTPITGRDVHWAIRKNENCTIYSSKEKELGIVDNSKRDIDTDCWEENLL